MPKATGIGFHSTLVFRKEARSRVLNGPPLDVLPS